jgi:hypothetical protein
MNAFMHPTGSPTGDLTALTTEAFGGWAKASPAE